jgi:hypothetical protein
MTFEPIEKGWNLAILEYGEQSPLENHGAFELGSDDENKLIYGSAALVRSMGLNSIVAACRGYVNK